MRQLFVLLCFALTLSAGPISVGPIYMSGSGSYQWAYGDEASETVNASGSNGTDSASLFVPVDGVDNNSFSPFLGLPSYIGPLGSLPCDGWNGDVTVDGITAEYSPDCGIFGNGNGATWYIENGGGSISIFDSSQNLLATAELVGYIDYANVVETFSGNTLIGVSATFTIVPTPEPATWGLTFAGLTMAILLILFRVLTARLGHVLQGAGNLTFGCECRSGLIIRTKANRTLLCYHRAVENRTEQKTVMQWVRYIVMAVIALILVWGMLRMYVL